MKARHLGPWLLLACTSHRATSITPTDSGPPGDAVVSDAPAGVQPTTDQAADLQHGADSPPDLARTPVSPGATTIVFKIAPGSSFCEQASVCTPRPVYEIKDAAGRSLPIEPPQCQATCPSCVAPPCPGSACTNQALDITGGAVTWDGSYYLWSQCSMGTACRDRAFAPAGHYTAVFCSTPGAIVKPDGGAPICMVTGNRKCTEVPFDLPGPTAEGVLGN
jgi:hypothetical protein